MTKKPVGRPKKVIDYEAAEKLAYLHCTQEEMASFLGVSTDTLRRDPVFCDIYKKGMDNGRTSLRRLQWKQAEEGNTTMLIWLGKQILGQRDKQELTGADGESLVTIHVNSNETKRDLKDVVGRLSAN